MNIIELIQKIKRERSLNNLPMSGLRMKWSKGTLDDWRKTLDIFDVNLDCKDPEFDFLGITHKFDGRIKEYKIYGNTV